MRRHDDATARALLTDLVRRFPADPLADAALLELARAAYNHHDEPAARAYLDELLARGGDGQLREPARYLRCRLDLESGRDAAAVRCLSALRHDHLSSPHDAEALALLASLLQARNDCKAAVSHLEEYLRLYPRGAFAVDARARLRRCAP
jgi:outer membrane protein assembly factor BamD (BamD/ComL family)